MTAYRTVDTTSPTGELALDLKRGPVLEQNLEMTLNEFLNFVLVFLPNFLFSIPVSILWHHVINRFRSSIVNVVGRPLYADIPIRITRFLFARATPAQLRVIFNGTAAYKTAYAGPDFKGFEKWVSYVKVNGTAGRWIAPPSGDRAKDDLVMFFVHGGGMIMDSGAGSQPWLMRTVKEMNLKRNIKFSVFSLDYRLAPENIYPSQLTEVLAGYHHLVNNLGISPSRICITGDSAGGCLVAAFLLHLARPNPAIKVPIALGPTPVKPASAILVSPWVKLVSHLPSRKANDDSDCIENGALWQMALDYVGVERVRPFPTWNPLNFICNPGPDAPKNVVKSAKGFTASAEKTLSGVELFSSPYVNPSVCEDVEWWKEACPGDGMTLVTWGGREILRDDIEEFVGTLTAAGVNPKTVKKELGIHDWLMFDCSIGGLHITKVKGAEESPNYGMFTTANFLETVVSRTRELAASPPESVNDVQKLKL